MIQTEQAEIIKLYCDICGALIGAYTLDEEIFRGKYDFCSNHLPINQMADTIVEMVMRPDRNYEVLGKDISAYKIDEREEILDLLVEKIKVEYEE